MRNNIKYWCCPSCGRVFFRTSTAVTNTTHYCSAHPGYMVQVEEPTEEVKKNIVGMESSTRLHYQKGE